MTLCYVKTNFVDLLNQNLYFFIWGVLKGPLDVN